MSISLISLMTLSLGEGAQNASDFLLHLASIDFWLGAPLRIIMIVLIGLILHAMVRLVIRKVTSSIARGTQSRVVAASPKKRQGNRWKTDTALSSARQSQRAKTVGSVLRSVASIVIWTVMIVMIIAELGFNIAPVIASAGVVGVALSFGAQSLVKDFLSGIFIVAEDQLGIGDWVDLGEASGEVEAVGLRTTQVRDLEGTLWHVRNGEILRVGNSSQGWARTVVDLPIPYDADIDEMADFLVEATSEALQKPGIKGNVTGKPEYLGVQTITGESVTLRLLVKTAPAAQFSVGRKLREELKKAMDARGIRMPHPNQSVILTEEQSSPSKKTVPADSQQ